MKKKWITSLIGILTLSALLAACAPQTAPTTDAAPQAPVASQADLSAVKAYAIDQATQMKDAAASLRAGAEQYYAAIAQIKADHPNANPYEYLWENHPQAAKTLLEKMRADWLESHAHYELNEGIIGGTPALAYYDGWLDAAPSADEDPEEAIQWTLKLANGATLESPGNLYHSLTEPILYGTLDKYVGLPVDLNGDGATGVSESLPEAEILLASTQALDEASAQTLAAINAWQPTLEDAFMAMVTMIPTMNEYFEQWKLSTFIAGNDFEQIGFVAASRLVDVNGILSGLGVAYDNIRPVVGSADAALDAQIHAGFADLTTYVADLYAKEQSGTVFSPEEADAFGVEAQSKATALAALVAQAAVKTNIALNLDAPSWEPASAPVVTANAPAPAPIE
ncbi:MAG: Efem/EfeO family lipoprotein [Anaerolineaceae bacterium]|nr:MAG: Efem/EfeO family lipoprotein [Anaerolineaceae bacterium]